MLAQVGLCQTCSENTLFSHEAAHIGIAMFPVFLLGARAQSSHDGQWLIIVANIHVIEYGKIVVEIAVKV